MKKCPKCNSENAADARFCMKCGNEFNKDSNFCFNCGNKNQKDARFCFKCGNALVSNTKNVEQKAVTRKKGKNVRDKKPGLNPVKIAAGILFIIIIYLIIPEDRAATTNQAVQRAQPVTEQKLSDPGQEALAMDIASKFICSCGTCGEQPLESCTCEVAGIEREFIRHGLQNGKDADTVIREVNAKYGWIKPQYEDKYGPGKFRLDKGDLPVPGVDILDEKKVQGVAAFEDRNAIISSFACTCGQCQIDELIDCNCSHPGGATEVKSYIDQKISEAKYSKENIIQLVEARYGARIR